MVVETEAEVGASGYSVVGGGTKGIFIKDVLKDSPAEKHLSLQKGKKTLFQNLHIVYAVLCIPATQKSLFVLK